MSQRIIVGRDGIPPIYFVSHRKGAETQRKAIATEGTEKRKYCRDG